jgi:hypothetical protein
MAMTNLEKIKRVCLYPVKEVYFLSVLDDRGIESEDDFIPTNAVHVKNMQLARADVFILLLTAPGSVGEGGYSLSASDRAVLQNLSASIYAKYGEETSIPRPAVRAKSPW